MYDIKNMIELSNGLTPIETEIGYYILKIKKIS